MMQATTALSLTLHVITCLPIRFHFLTKSQYLMHGEFPLTREITRAPSRARACQPCGHGALIESEGGDNSLGRTAMAQQGQDECHHIRIRGRPQQVEGRAFGGGEGLATADTPIALPPLGYARECSLSHAAL